MFGKIMHTLLALTLIFAASQITIGCSSSSHGGHGDMQMSMKHKNIMISEAWVRAAPPVAKHAAGYLTIQNMGNQDEALVSISMDRKGMLEVHDMRKKGDMMEMFPLDMPLTIPAGGKVMLMPGGKHLMMMKLNGGPQIGETFTFTLNFRNAGHVTVKAMVMEGKMPAGMKMKH